MTTWSVTTSSSWGYQKQKREGTENLFEEIMTKNFSNLVKEKDTEVQEAQRIPNKMNPKRPISRHIII